ncbi:MAG: FixH family protein [Phycisphaeraceae bacterium]|nr:FixH family protein [Phycisphaeraceae bacterium]
MKRLNLFPGIIFALLGLNFVIVGITVYAANSDGGAVIEPNYYQRALHWDDQRALEERGRVLGWSAGVELTVKDGATAIGVKLADRAGDPIGGATVRALAFRSADAGRRHELILREVGPGRYEGLVPTRGGGAWQVELRIQARGELFTYVASVSAEGAP